MDDDERPEGLRRLITAIASMGADLDLPVVLRRITEAATELVGATYGALGVLSPEGTNLSAFITVGIDDDTAAQIGELPKGHGILGLLIVRPEPLRLDDLRQHGESFGFPPGHPEMSSFLGVPIQVRGRVFGNLYLTDKRGGGGFTADDQELAIALASAAGIAIESSRLLARERQIDIANERERIARDLHDTVIQRLFATGLSLQSAARLSDQEPVVDRIQQAVDELDVTVRDVRASIFELNPPATSSHGLRRRLLAVGDELFDALGSSPTFRFEGPVDSAVPDELGTHVVAVVREGLANAAKHARSGSFEVRVAVEADRVVVTVADRGQGLGDRRPGGHGLDNLTARAEQVGGTFQIGPRSGGGTEIRWIAPLT